MDPNAQPVPLDEEVKDLETVDVPEDENTEPTDKTIDVDAAEKDAQDFKKLDDKAFYALRKEAAEAKRERDELRRKVSDYEKRPAVRPEVQPQPVDVNRNREVIGGIPVPQTKEEWDILARKDWQAAVDLRSIIAARKVRDEHVIQQRTAQSLDESKNKVLAKHPELNDANSEKAQIFLKILDKNPEYLTMSKGPILAMRDMEDEMEALGYSKEQIFDTKKAVAQTEATRVNRAALTAGGRTPAKTGRQVHLSKDDMEFCKNQGIDPLDYAKQKLEQENNRKGAQL